MDHLLTNLNNLMKLCCGHASLEKIENEIKNNPDEINKVSEIITHLIFLIVKT